VADAAARAGRRAAATAGIYRLGDQGRWQALGAGVCLRVSGRGFVFSTGRVLVPSARPLWLGGRRAIVPLLGVSVLGGGPGAPPQLATLDAAFGLLAGDDAEALEGDVEFLSLADVDLYDGTRDDVYYAVAAGPLADRTSSDAPPAEAPVTVRPAPPRDYRKHGVDFATHLVLQPERDGGWPWGLDRLRGSGIWRASGGAAADPLAGIVIDAVGGDEPRIVATRPCFTVLGIGGCLGAGLPESAPVRSRN
jgi:hypothetical protein